MNYKHLAGALALLAPVVLTGCIDNNYDLSDLDTTTRINVNNLTLPINVAPITLDNLIEFDEDGIIQTQEIDGVPYYVIKQGGKPEDAFSSGEIEIQTVYVNAPVINDTPTTLSIIAGLNKAKKSNGKRIDGIDIPDWEYQMNEQIGADFEYTDGNIPREIVSVEHISTMPFRFEMTLTIGGLGDIFEKLTFSDVDIQLPKNLDAKVAAGSPGSYNATTGVWHIDALDITSTNVKIAVEAQGVTFAAGESPIKDGQLNFKGQFRINKGKMILKPKVNGYNIPDPNDYKDLAFNVAYKLGDLDIRRFTGEIAYTLDDLNIDPVSLSDIPDFLQGDQTVIKLPNPQIYVNIENPLYQQSQVSVETGVKLVADRGEGVTRSFEAAKPIVIKGQRTANYLLAQNPDAVTPQPGYTQNLNRISVPDLGELLAPAQGQAAGLPKAITIELPGAGLGQHSRAVNFELGQNIGEVTGNWMLFAPLALADGSNIIYEEKVRDWYSDEMKDLHITGLTLIADADNEAPMGINLFAYPVCKDKDGNEVRVGVLKTEKPLAANSQSPLEIKLTLPEGTDLTSLDGMDFVATLTGGNGTPLSPDQVLNLKNIRITVDGYYTTSF